MSAPPLHAAALRRRFLVLRAMRWFPTGVVIPVFILLMTSRGLSLGQIGLVAAAQGLTILLLELPTGGLADALGRRRVLLAATVLEVASTALLAVVTSLSGFVLVALMWGVYRALESGPLDSWYVDSAQAIDPDADIESAIGAAGTVLGVAIAAGSLLSSALVALDPLPSVTLTLPVLVAAGLRAVDAVAIAVLMVEAPRAGHRSLGAGLASIPAVVRDAVHVVRGSRVLVGLIAVELLWGAGMAAFENLTPPRLEEVAGSADAAAAIYGPASAAGWVASAAGASAIAILARRITAPWAAVATRVLQGVTVVGIALFGDAVMVAIAFVATMAVHGAANAVHQGLLHRAVVGPERRATVVSANSLCASVGGAVGGIVLGVIADVIALPVAILIGAVILVLPAPLYLRRDAAEDRGRPQPAWWPPHTVPGGPAARPSVRPPDVVLPLDLIEEPQVIRR